jgi:anti-sigma factor RsiW
MRFLRNNEPREEELTALADGSLAPERLAALEAQVAASSELADRLAEQRRAVVLTRSAAAEVEAPASLRARIDAQQRRSRVSARPRPVLIGVAAAAVVAVAVGTPLRPHLRRTFPGCPRPDSDRACGQG